MKYFKVYSKVFTSVENEEDNCDETIHVKGRYSLLEAVTREWYGDMNRGLARYLHDDLDKHVDYIQYYYVNHGYICFDVKLKSDSETIVNYRGKEITLYQAVCDYIQGQISDGWGENGIILWEWIHDKALSCYCSWELYEEDYEASMKLAEENNDRFGGFHKYPMFKEIQLK